MLQDTLLPFSFPAVGRKKVSAAFDGGRMTSDGGVMLLGAVERRIGLARKGGDRAAILYTLIETAKLNGLNPEAYLAYAIDQLARGHLASRLSELLPWNCKGAVEDRAA